MYVGFVVCIHMHVDVIYIHIYDYVHTYICVYIDFVSSKNKERGPKVVAASKSKMTSDLKSNCCYACIYITRGISSSSRS